jgi:hypothetical protein
LLVLAPEKILMLMALSGIPLQAYWRAALVMLYLLAGWGIYRLLVTWPLRRTNSQAVVRYRKYAFVLACAVVVLGIFGFRAY